MPIVIYFEEIIKLRKTRCRIGEKEVHRLQKEQRYCIGNKLHALSGVESTDELNSEGETETNRPRFSPSLSRVQC